MTINTSKCIEIFKCNFFIFIEIFRFKGSKGMVKAPELVVDAKNFLPKMPIYEHIDKQRVLGLFHSNCTENEKQTICIQKPKTIKKKNIF